MVQVNELQQLQGSRGRLTPADVRLLDQLQAELGQQGEDGGFELDKDGRQQL
jgi:hypothetical protein